VASGCLVWLIVVWMTCRSYVAGLLDSIGVHHFDPADEALAFDDPAVENHVRQALRTAPDEEVLYLLGIASHMDNVDLRIEFRELMARNLPEIKVAALDHLRRHGTAEDAPWARAALDHEAPGVRTAAIRALSALAREDATRSIEVLLDDPDADVRAAATTELINVGDLEGLLAACTRLKEMLRSGDERDRASAARAIANVNHAGLSKLLADLLSDPDLTVRRAALLACADRPDPRLIPSILPVLSDPDLAVSAVDVLGTFGRSVIDYLASFPDDVDRRPVEELLLIPSVLAQTRDAAVSRSGQDQSVEALLSTEHSEWIVASAAYTAGRIPGVSSTGAIHRLLASSSWYVREAALDAYSRLAGKEAVRSAAQSMVDDPSERVRKVALRIMDEVRA
jgi:HEAT repeat protein